MNITLSDYEDIKAENERLRLMLANSNADCAYCGLKSEDMNKCKFGFPGCGRSDDMMLGDIELPDTTPIIKFSIGNVVLNNIDMKLYTIFEIRSEESFVLECENGNKLLAHPVDLELNNPGLQKTAIEMQKMIELGTKAWADVPENFIEELRSE
jgi:hypothetical protein